MFSMQYEIGTIVEGKVTGITKFGAFVEFGEGQVGMVHISEVSSTYVNDISEHLKDQQKVTVKILNVNDDGKISLSIKKALPQQQFTPRSENRPNNFNNNKGRTDQAPRQNGNFNRNNNRNVGSTYRPPQPTKPVNFDDMLSKFLQTSDEKTYEMKRDKTTRRAGQKRNRDYD